MKQDININIVKTLCKKVKVKHYILNSVFIFIDSKLHNYDYSDIYGFYSVKRNVIIINKSKCLRGSYKISDILLHELLHATGRKTLFNRKSLLNLNQNTYLKNNMLEEIIVERARNIISKTLNLTTNFHSTSYILDMYVNIKRLIRAVNLHGGVRNKNSFVKIQEMNIPSLINLYIESNPYVKEICEYVIGGI